MDGEPQLVDAELGQEEVEGAAEEREAIADADRLVRRAEAGKVQRDDAIGARDRPHDVTPEERGRRPAVEQEHRRSVPELAVGETQFLHLHCPRRCRRHVPLHR